MTEIAIRNDVIPHQDLPLTAGEIRAQVNLVQEVMKAVMRDGEHYGKVPGCGDKPTLLQPGAQKLMLTFKLAPKPTIEVIDLPRGHREYRLTMALSTHRGILLGEGVGSCSTMESKYRYRTGPVEYTDKRVPKEYWDLRQTDPAKAKALLGAGHVAKKNDAGLWVCAVQGEKVEHDNPADYYNTCLKIAYKRALVSATLCVTGASDIFTQDIEEMEDLVIPTKATAMSTPAMTLTEKVKLKAADKAGGSMAGGSLDRTHQGQPPEGPPPSPHDEEKAAPGGALAPILAQADNSGAPRDASGSGPSPADDVIAQVGLCETIKEWSGCENEALAIYEQGGFTAAQWARYRGLSDQKKAQFTAKKK